MVMVKMVKIDFHLSKSATIINILYLYIVSQMTESENENDQNDLDHFDRRSLLALGNCVKCCPLAAFYRKNVVCMQHFLYLCTIN